MKKYTVYIILIGLASFFHSCSKDGVAKYVLVPQPQEAVFNEEEYFTLNDNTTLAYSDGDSHLMNNALTCLSEVEQITGITLRRASDSSTDKNCISLKTDSDIKPEGYRMTVSKEKVEISAADSVGFFYGMQTIKHAVMLQQSTGNYQLMGGYISDAPAMPYRGAMLDVSRNFFDVAQVKRFIDMLAMHKLNYFHWHLTDDQGWRIEIKKYPALTSTRAWRTVRDKRSGGYYTQTQISEIIAYAAQRCITVIPEIDLPGHTSAALAAYPMLGCTGGPYQVATESGGVHKDVICLGKESSYQFIHDVMAEVAALFPAPYIHIGGDEVPRDRWKGCAHCQRAISKRQLKGNRHFSPEDLLQGDFNKHIATYLRTLGKRMIAWDEVIADNIDKETIIMSWRGLNKGVDAIKRGHHAIFSSNGDFYLNNYQTTDMNKAPKATGGFLPMQKVYHTALTNLPLSVQEQQLMMGAEACLWTSYVPDEATLQYMMLPRLAVFAEVVWSGKSRPGYEDFLQRLPDMLTLYQAKSLAYAPCFFFVDGRYIPDMENKRLKVELTTIKDAEVYYTLDGTAPDRHSIKYTEPFYLDADATVKAIAYTSKDMNSELFEREFNHSLSTFAEVALLSEPHLKYGGNEGKVLVDGIRSEMYHNTGMWVGCNPEPLEVVLNLKSVQKIKEVTVSSLVDMSSYIMGIERLTVYTSVDGVTFEEQACAIYQEPEAYMEGKRVENLKLTFDSRHSKYVKVRAEGFSALPQWHFGAGQSPFLFVDEIEIN